MDASVTLPRLVSWPRRGAAAAIVVLLAGLAMWAFVFEPASLRGKSYPLAVPSWPAACDGLRIAVLADLHVGSPFNGLANLDRIIATTDALQPDLVLVPGDLVVTGVLGGKFVPPEVIATRLSALAAPLGTYAVLGNHDAWFDRGRVVRSLEQAGVPVLEDRARLLTAKGCRIWLAGVSDFWEGRHDVNQALAAVPDRDAVVAFTHNPDVFPAIPSRVALTIAGHTHGGQVALPFIGPPVVPSRYGQRYAGGHIVERGRHLFVSTGIGTSILPVRFGVPPEVSLVVLRAVPSRAQGQHDAVARAFRE